MEFIRRSLRNFLPKKFYSKLALLADSFFVVMIEGTNKLKTLNSKDANVKEIRLKTVNQPFYFRTNDLDRNLVIQNLIRKEYDIKKNVQINKGFIIDAGAYIGDVSCFFASKYPCKIISLEPNENSFNFAIKNTSLYPQIKLLNKGLWYKKAKLVVKGEGTGSEVIETDDKTFDIDGISISEIVKEYNIKLIEILKIDIEGAEEIIFSNDISDWINQVKVLIIEIHSDNGKALIFKTLSKYGFTIKPHRSVYFCYNKSLINNL